MQPPVLVVVLFGGVRGMHLVCVPLIICGSQGHKFRLADSRRMNSFELEYWIPARDPKIWFCEIWYRSQRSFVRWLRKPTNMRVLTRYWLSNWSSGNDQPLGLLFGPFSFLPHPPSCRWCAWLKWPHTGWFSNMFCKLASLKQMSEMHGQIWSGVPTGS